MMIYGLMQECPTKDGFWAQICLFSIIRTIFCQKVSQVGQNTDNSESILGLQVGLLFLRNIDFLSRQIFALDYSIVYDLRT
jgi:hypothetical protein